LRDLDDEVGALLGKDPEADAASSQAFEKLRAAMGGGLHSPTFQLNLTRF